MNKPVDEKLTSVARLPLWMYVLAWLVRTTRPAEHDPNAAPIHKSGPTETGDNSPVKERTPLELYANIIDAYQNTAKLYQHINMVVIRLGIFLSIPLLTYLLFISSILSIIIVVIMLCTLFYIYCKVIYNRLKHDGMLKYGGLTRRIGLDPTSAPHEVYRYFLFREKLIEYNIRAEDVKFVIPLLESEHKTLGSYVAQHPLHVWIASTLTAILAASATTWHFKLVAIVVGIGIVALGVLWAVELSIGVHRTQYELRRWLTWYKADDSGTVVDPAPGSTNSLAD